MRFYYQEVRRSTVSSSPLRFWPRLPSTLDPGATYPDPGEHLEMCQRWLKS